MIYYKQVVGACCTRNVVRLVKKTDCLDCSKMDDANNRNLLGKPKKER